MRTHNVLDVIVVVVILCTIISDSKSHGRDGGHNGALWKANPMHVYHMNQGTCILSFGNALLTLFVLFCSYFLNIFVYI